MELLCVCMSGERERERETDTTSELHPQPRQKHFDNSISTRFLALDFEEQGSLWLQNNLLYHV